MMKQSDGCSTLVLISSSAKQWTVTARSNDEEEAMDFCLSIMIMTCTSSSGNFAESFMLTDWDLYAGPAITNTN